MPDVLLFSGISIKRTEIKNYFTETYFSAVRIYNEYKRFGMPWSDGYMTIPDYLKQIYDIFESTVDQYRTYNANKMANKKG